MSLPFQRTGFRQTADGGDSLRRFHLRNGFQHRSAHFVDRAFRPPGQRQQRGEPLLLAVLHKQGGDLFRASP